MNWRSSFFLNLEKKLTQVSLSTKISSIRILLDTDKMSSSLAKVGKESSKFLKTVFPEHFSNGKYVGRTTHAEFIELAMEKMDELGASKDIEVYKELLRIFPEGKYAPLSRFDKIGLFNPVQQLVATRLLVKMEQNLVRPDKEIEYLVIKAFSKHSDVWLKIARMNYWSMKFRNIDGNPVPEKLPKEVHKLAIIALKRMINTVDRESVITVKNTHNLPDVIDKTWIAYCQSPLQRDLISELDENTVLYVESAGFSYVGENALSYYVLKCYTEKHKEDIKPNAKLKYTFDANRIKFQFFGKPLKDKVLDLNPHHISNYQLLGMAITGTSSHDSLVSWIKILQESNPKLSKMTVMFNIENQMINQVDGKPTKAIRESSKLDLDEMMDVIIKSPS